MKLALDVSAILEASPDALLITNPQGEILYVNAQTEAIFGYTQEELLGNAIEKLIPERYRERHIAHRANYFANPRSRFMGTGLELYGLHKNGTEFPAEISLSPLETETGIVVLSAVRDITLRKKAEAKFKAILEAMPDALIIVDRQGKIILANVQAEVLFQYSRSELLNMTLEQLIPERYRVRHQFHRNSFFNEPRTRPMGIGRNLYGLKKDNNEFPVEISLSPLDSEEKMWALAAIRDATERKRCEQDLHEKNQALQTYRERQEEFISTVCHEIRNPLNVIYGEVDLLSQKLDLLEKTCESSQSSSNKELLSNIISCKEDIKIIKECSQQQKIIVDDVLDFAKLESDKIELNLIPFSLRDMIYALASMFKPQIQQKHLNLQLDIPDDDIWLKADMYRLRQIIVNLLSNAVKFTHEGTISILLTVQSLSFIEATLSISVKDTGIGMTSEEVKRLFARFSQANPQVTAQYGGTGLGLLICKKIVDKMQGDIQVESEKGKGSLFSFSIKCARVTSEEKLQLNIESASKKHSSSKTTSSEKTSDSSLSRGVNKTILIVEDNEMNQKILENYLRQKGYFSQVASNGLDAIQLFNEYQFDLILMDIEMPIMGGLEATQQIRAKEKGLGRCIPIIGLSGNARDEQVRAAKEAGMNAYLTKPYHKEQLYSIIDEYTASSEQEETKPFSPPLKAIKSSSSFFSPQAIDEGPAHSTELISLDTEQLPANTEQQKNQVRH